MAYRLSLLKFFFLGIGCLLFLVAAFSYIATQSFLNEAQEAQGKVLDLVQTQKTRSSGLYTYRPMVGFVTKSGKYVEFVSATGTNPAAYTIGDQVVVLYIPGKEQHAKINSFFSLWGIALICGFVAAVFCGLGGAWFAYDTYRKTQIRRLKQSGCAVRARIVDVSTNPLVHVNGQCPFRITAQWQNPRTDQVHVFRSENIWFDPTPFLTEDEISVLVNENTPRVYLVDLSFLPEPA